MASIGFITIGTPNKTGSLMLKIPGTKVNLPILLSCCDLAKNTMKITNPMVIPAPVTVENWSNKP